MITIAVLGYLILGVLFYLLCAQVGVFKDESKRDKMWLLEAYALLLWPVCLCIMLLAFITTLIDDSGAE